MADINGDGGNNPLTGTAENDLIRGFAGDDTLDGLDGDDTLEAGTGRDRLSGGAGDDRIDSSAGDRASEGPGDVVTPGLGQDTVIGSSALWGDGGGIDLGYAGISGVGGITVASGPNGTGTAVSGDGSIDDTFSFVDFIFGSDEDDLLISHGVPGRFQGLEGLAGNDTLRGGADSYDAAVYLFSGGTRGIVADLNTGLVTDTFGDTDTLENIDEITGSDFNDEIAGDGSDNWLIGEGGDDIIFGRGGNDFLEDGSGDDSLSGGAGDDFFDNRGGADTFDGGTGRDEILTDLSDLPFDTFVVDLVAGTQGRQNSDLGRDTLIGIEDVTVRGTWNVSITGSNADNRLETGAGDDTLIGAGGRDRLQAGAGDDLIDASGGSTESQGHGDYIRPGLGSDTIVGHQGLFEAGENTDLSYADIEGVGGITLTITDGATGSGTVTAPGGVIDDTFTYMGYFEASQDGDLLIGSDSGDLEVFVPLGGADTIRGGDGYDGLNYQYEHEYFDGAGSGIVADFAAGTLIDTQGSTDVFSGIEEIRGSVFGDRIDAAGETRDLRLQGQEGNDTLRGGDGDDRLQGGDGTDTAIVGGNSADALATLDGTYIRIETAFGSDRFESIELFRFDDATLSADALFAGEVPGQQLSGTAGDDTLTGNAGGDRIEGGAGDDLLNGAGGDDGLLGQTGNDTLLGGFGDDNIAASDGNDSVEGEGGDDFVGGGEGDDFLGGGDGNDTLGGGFGDDTIAGDAGDDVAAGGAGNDDLSGGSGSDTMGASFGDDVVFGQDGDDSLGGGTGRDLIVGGDDSDSIGGGEGNDTVEGGAGDDFLAGGGRDDVVTGGSGDDAINGGAGNDVLSGDAGADVFIWTEGEAGAVDLVLDFEDGVDLLRLAGVENAPGSGLVGRVDALQIVDAEVNGTTVAELSYQGQTILLSGVDAANLGVEDFIFV
ncbi:calcium-binding protein [Roseivivax sediminis]|uniref:Hemolysin-type calcium-binding repeat-containing protein n=1 Tax=Roseivivax sediminis TaxID=936889 RepID=A0A1I1ZQE9_9RHOB|nr:calcium-binding protein [Roseivivax sediminis]SFE33895.1 Hemolysin-type calcium-binding repeat-containing protein [Roseivivax sediminis]